MKVIPSRPRFAWATSIVLILACCIPAVAAARKPGDAALAKAPRAPSRTLSLVENFQFPLTTTLPNPCNLEDVLLTGTLRLTINATASASGGTHVYISTDYKDMSGEGAFGNRYVYSNVFQPLELNDPAGPPSIFRVEDSQELVSVSSQVPNFITHVTFLISVSPAFLPAASVDNVRVECRG
jgi:hypothetical protein